MAVPTWVAAGTLVAGNSQTPGLPSGWQEGDIFILTAQSESNSSITTPSGWNVVTGSPVAATTAPEAWAFWRRATSSESAPTVTYSGGDTGGPSRIHAFRGCVASGDPINASASRAQSSTQTNHTCETVTTTVADCLVVFVLTGWNDVTSFGSYTNGNLANLTERADDGSSFGFTSRLALAHGEKASAGSTGTTSVTAGSSTQGAFITLALAPAGGASTNASSETTSAASTSNQPTFAARASVRYTSRL